MAIEKKKTSLALSAEARGILETYADRLGVNKTSIMEIAIREYRDNHKEVDSERVRDDEG